MILLGFAALTSGIEFFTSGTSTLAAVFVLDFESRECACGSSSKSSSEKSKSCAERGAAESANTEGCAKLSGGDFWGAESAKSSRAICVPLSRKSSQPSRASCVAAGTCKEVGGFEGTGARAFEAGRPGNLKLGLGLICDLGLLAGGAGFLTTAGS